MRLRSLLLLHVVIAWALWPATASSQSDSPLTGGVARPEGEQSQVMVRTILIRPRDCNTELSSRFMPSQDQLTKGIAAPIFLRMNWEATSRMKILRELYTNEKLDTPLDELDTKKIDNKFPISLTEMSRAVFRERAGWEYPLNEEPHFEIMLPDMQESRLYVHAMLLKARSLIKQGKVEDAERMLCLVIGLAKHIGEAPFIISRLVQYSQTNDAIGVIEELLQHPEAPNYYWDFVSLPRPFIDVRTAIQLENAMFTKSIKELGDLERLETEEQWKALARKIVDSSSLWAVTVGESSLPNRGTPEAEAALKDWVALSRERLPKIAPELAGSLSQMSDAEVGVRYWWLRVQSRTELHLALSLLEPQFAIHRVIADFERLRKDSEDELPVRLASGIGSGFIVAAALMDQRIVMLRAIESIRDYAAAHDGKLPRSLAELELPIPADPLSGKPLQYKAAADSRSAVLSGATVEHTGWSLAKPEKKTVRGMRYELKVAK